MAFTRDIRWTLLANLVEDAANAGTPLEGLGLLEEVLMATRSLQSDEAREALRAGETWARIADAVGVTKQGAWSRWSPHAVTLDQLRRPTGA